VRHALATAFVVLALAVPARADRPLDPVWDLVEELTDNDPGDVCYLVPEGLQLPGTPGEYCAPAGDEVYDFFERPLPGDL
jgi:hypothetical protein